MEQVLKHVSQVIMSYAYSMLDVKDVKHHIFAKYYFIAEIHRPQRSRLVNLPPCV